jgi:hypothetical protein
MALAGLVFAAAALTAGVFALIPGMRPFTAVPMAWAPMAAFPLIHSGLVRWNRYTTGLADPSDVLNGVSGGLAALAALNVVLHGSALTAGPWWEVQALLAQVATDLVLLGTALSVVGLGAMGRDLRQPKAHRSRGRRPRSRWARCCCAWRRSCVRRRPLLSPPTRRRRRSARSSSSPPPRPCWWPRR